MIQLSTVSLWTISAPKATFSLTIPRYFSILRRTLPPAFLADTHTNTNALLPRSPCHAIIADRRKEYHRVSELQVRQGGGEHDAKYVSCCTGHSLPPSTPSHFRMNFRLRLTLLMFSARPSIPQTTHKAICPTRKQFSTFSSRRSIPNVHVTTKIWGIGWIRRLRGSSPGVWLMSSGCVHAVLRTLNVYG